ncbi:hypothetical protein MCCARTNEY_239 [Bacillus phage vB_BanH_McCartney]|nr:hypothetical protein MCCARTNEY_239 [Bacillus phage vB_BanH_McCartney]
MRIIVVNDPYYIHREKDEDVIKFTPRLPKKVIPFEIDNSKVKGLVYFHTFKPGAEPFDYHIHTVSVTTLAQMLINQYYKEDIMEAKKMNEPTLEEKITFCYKISAMIGEEVECCFEDMLPENLEKAYNYCVEREYELRHKGE